MEAYYQTYPLSVYDTLAGCKRPFEPLEEGKVGLYVCGPTVYSPVHLGNVRTFITFDLIYRYLKHLGYTVRYVRNITDAGHLEADADEGEDKIAKKARLERIEPMQVVQRYTLDFHEVLRAFNTLPPDIEPTATGHIVEQIEIARKLLAKGLAYEVKGSVYFDVKRYDQTQAYGELSRRQLQEMIAHSRPLQGVEEKKNPQDFALWKKAPPNHLMRWPSPWGEGFPGWHLECTAMSTKYLGAQFDLHGGGIDLKFPHHECEIAQARGLHGKPPVRYWLHANMLTLNGEKMSKSSGNTVLPRDLLNGENPFFKKAFPAPVIRFLMMQAHYRSVLDLSDEAIQAAERGYLKLMKGTEGLAGIQPGPRSDFDVQGWIEQAYQAMSDDFNSPLLLARLFEAVRWIAPLKAGTAFLKPVDLKRLKEKFHTFLFDILGLKPLQTQRPSDKLSEVVKILIELRARARAERNWAGADQIRDRLATLGIQLKDERGETTFSMEN